MASLTIAPGAESMRPSPGSGFLVLAGQPGWVMLDQGALGPAYPGARLAGRALSTLHRARPTLVEDAAVVLSERARSRSDGLRVCGRAAIAHAGVCGSRGSCRLTLDHRDARARDQGYPLLALIRDGKPRLMTRSATDWTHRFPDLVALLEALPLGDVALDGELLAPARDGCNDSERLLDCLRQGRTAQLVYRVFDLDQLDGAGLADSSWRERQMRLRALFDQAGLLGHRRLSLVG